MVKRIFLTHHSHTDIGYTDDFGKIAEDHADFPGPGFRVLPEDRFFSERSQFRWTCETSWMVRSYFQKRPGKIPEFVRRVKEGRIEITALYLNLTDLYDFEMLIRSLSYSEELKKKYGIEIKTAMNCDINGLSWNMPNYWKNAGLNIF